MSRVRPSARGRGRAPIRVAIADRHLAFAEALRIALSQVRGIRVTGVTHDLEGLGEAVRSRGADVALVDEGVPAHDALWEMKDAVSGLRVLLLTASDEHDAVATAAERGADAVVARTRPLRDVVRAIRSLSRGESLIDPEVVRHAAFRRRRRREDRAALAERLDRLTSREVEILQHMADGLPPDEVAERLGISPNTLRTHVQNVLMKLRVHSKLQAVTAAIRHGRVHVRREGDVTIDVERRVLDLTASGSRGGAYAGGTSDSTSAARSGRGRSRGSSR